MTENEFKEKAPKLFKELKEQVQRIEESNLFIEENLNLIDDVESDFDSGDVAGAMKKYYLLRRKIEKANISLLAKPLIWKLFWIEIVYLCLLLLIGYFTYRLPDFFLWKGLINLHSQTAWFGALGGITIAFYGIYNHVQSRDFDPQYQLWYICKPIMGAIFGWFIYMIYYVGVISVQGLSNGNVKYPELPFVIAFLAGFSERFTIKLIDQLMSVLTTWKDKSDTATPK